MCNISQRFNNFLTLALEITRNDILREFIDIYKIKFVERKGFLLMLSSEF